MFNRKQLARLIWPLIVEQFLAVAIGMADTVMVTSCGEAAVAGVSLVDSINVLLINIFRRWPQAARSSLPSTSAGRIRSRPMWRRSSSFWSQRAYPFW